MRNFFEEQLALLNTELIRMGALCEDAIAEAAKTLSGETEHGENVRQLEREIDQKERDIENLCFKLLLKQQPVARDLRLVSSALKMISDMERIGDQASDIVEVASFMAAGEAESHRHIMEMASAAGRMVTESIDSFVKRDLNLARKVIREDDVVDALFDEVRRDIVEMIGGRRQAAESTPDRPLTVPGAGETKMAETLVSPAMDSAGGGKSRDVSGIGEDCIDLLMIGKYFERIGDHAVNIAEWVEYSVTGAHKEAG